jgi:hypothetical protein
MVFYVTPGINADHMVAKNGRLCKLEGEPVKTERNIAPLGDNRNDIVYRGDRVTFPILYKGKGKALATGSFLGGAKAKQGKTETLPVLESEILEVNTVERNIDHFV